MLKTRKDIHSLGRGERKSRKELVRNSRASQVGDAELDSCL